MEETYKRAYSEVYEILKLVSDELKNKVPKKFWDAIEKERDLNYNPEFKTDVPLENQNLMKETISILAVLKLNCWCNEQEKKEFIEMLNENEKKFQKEINEKYNPDNLFKKDEDKITKEENISNIEEKDTEQINDMVQYKENIFIKFIKKLKAWIFRNKKLNG